jgi:AcrR family transcriptional regulator
MTALMNGRISAIVFVTDYHDIVWLYKENIMTPGTPIATAPAAGHSPRLRPTDRRGEIIAAAIQVIARDGLRACTVSALERETGFARGHFTYHFTAKEEIISLAFATVASDWGRTQWEAIPADTAYIRLEQRVRAAVRWAQERPDYFRCLMNFRVEIMRNPGAFPPSAAIRHQLWEFAAQMIREGVTEGNFRPVNDPLLEARTVFAIVDGFLLHSAMDPTFCPADELADRAWGAVAHQLGAGRNRT